MESSRKLSQESVLLATSLACVGAATAIMVGVVTPVEAGSPVWLRPAMVMGGFALLVGAVLCAPALRRQRAG